MALFNNDKRFIGGNQVGIAGNTAGCVPVIFPFETTSGVSSYNLVMEYPVMVIGVSGIMTGAGAASDTIVVNKSSSAISDTIDVSALADKTWFEATTIDDAYSTLQQGDTLNVTTASGAVAQVYVWAVRVG